MKKWTRIPASILLLSLSPILSAQAQPTFRPGQPIMIHIDGKYVQGTASKVSRSSGCTYVSYHWKSGNRSGTGTTSPDCIKGSILTMEEARRRRLNVANPAPPTAQVPQTEEFLRAHNRWRAEAGVPNLVWSDAAAASAQQCANQLAASGKLAHTCPAAGYGENLAGGHATPTEVVDDWASEKATCGYRGEAINNQNFNCVGHYTQIVWRNSKEVGCGAARTADGTSFWVCRYHPAGNIVGTKPF